MIGYLRAIGLSMAVSMRIVQVSPGR